MKKIFIISCLILGLFGLWQVKLIVFAETSGSSPESGTSSRIKTAYDWLVAKGTNYGSTDAPDWDSATTYPWGTWWNRIMESAAWEPEGSATETDVLSDKTFYSGSNNRTVKTGTMSTQTLSDANETVNAGYYNATTLSAVDTDLAGGNIKSGITIFGFAGDSNVIDTSSGDAIAGDIFNGKIAFSDGSSLTGTLNLACNTATFDGTGNLVADAYDGTGTGLNRWCITDSGDAAAGNILSGKIAWVDGASITGTIPTQTLSANSETVSAGYYNATTLSAVDIDLAAANILSGKTIFGIAGSVSAGYPYGDDVQNTVLTTALGAGTYNVTNLSNSVIKQGTTWGVNLGSTGTLTPDGGTAAVADLFNGKTAHLTADWTLDTGTLNLACNTATFDGAGNLVADAYDGAGNGTNRWCITDSGDAVADDILSGKIAWVDGAAVTGTIDTQTLSAANETVSAGYYNATTLSVVDSDLASANIVSGKTIFGFAGTVPAAIDYSQQSLVEWDDYKTGDETGEESTWTNTAGTATTGVWKDGRTGLYWSASQGSKTNIFPDTDHTTCDYFNQTLYPTRGAYPGDDADCGVAINACGTLDLAAGGTSSTDWYLPSQKELQQAYTDGIYNQTNTTFVSTSIFWSSTEKSNGATYAWIVRLYYGYTDGSAKTSSNDVRCVRRD